MNNVRPSSNASFWKSFLVMFVLMVGIAPTQLSTAETVGEKTTTDSKTSMPAADQSVMCGKVSALIKSKMVLKYVLDSVNVPETPNTDSYLNMDIDGDDISDKIIRGCGTSECLLEIQLSGGNKIEFSDGLFFLIRLGGQVYLIVAGTTRGFFTPNQNPVFTLYSVSAKGVQKECDSHKERR